jgi:hypothetical protein
VSVCSVSKPPVGRPRALVFCPPFSKQASLNQEVSSLSIPPIRTKGHELQASANKNPPSCPSCGRVCDPAATWRGANYCRGFSLLQFIEQHHGLSGSELSQLSGMAYADATRGLQKLREWKVVSTEIEERIEGAGFRYRYLPGNDRVARDRSIGTLKVVEARQ